MQEGCSQLLLYHSWFELLLVDCFSEGKVFKEITIELLFQIKALHLYDCLRANKSTSAWGLEARVPFLDKGFIDIAMDIDPEWKMVNKSPCLSIKALNSCFSDNYQLKVS